MNMFSQPEILLGITRAIPINQEICVGITRSFFGSKDSRTLMIQTTPSRLYASDETYKSTKDVKRS